MPPDNASSKRHWPDKASGQCWISVSSRSGGVFLEAAIAHQSVKAGFQQFIQATGAGSGAVQRELARLAGSGLLTVEHVGNLKRYRANPDAPIHDELVSIVRKTFGLAEPLREALAPLSDRIHAAFLYGSIAKGSDTARSDIDLMVIADDLAYADVMLALHPVAERLGRLVNPTVYARDELRTRIDAGNSFVTRVLQQPRQWLIGGEDDLAA